MCTLPPEPDCGTLLALALLRAASGSNWFKTQANFELVLVSALKKGGGFSGILLPDVLQWQILSSYCTHKAWFLELLLLRTCFCCHSAFLWLCIAAMSNTSTSTDRQKGRFVAL